MPGALNKDLSVSQNTTHKYHTVSNKENVMWIPPTVEGCKEFSPSRMGLTISQNWTDRNRLVLCPIPRNGPQGCGLATFELKKSFQLVISKVMANNEVLLLPTVHGIFRDYVINGMTCCSHLQITNDNIPSTRWLMSKLHSYFGDSILSVGGVYPLPNDWHSAEGT